MKKRYLRDWIEKLLIGFEIALFMLLVGVDDFSVDKLTIAILAFAWMLFFGILWLLKTYGKLTEEIFHAN